MYSPDPAVYPFFEIYPGHVVAPQEFDVQPSVKLAKVYPALDICAYMLKHLCVAFDLFIDPTVYPAFEIYPGYVIDVRVEDTLTPLPVTLKAHYPAFDLC